MKTPQKKTMLIVNDLFHREGGVEILIDEYIRAWAEKYTISLLGYCFPSLSKAELPSGIARYYQRSFAPDAPIKAIAGSNMVSDALSARFSRDVSVADDPFSFDIVLAMKEGPVMKAAANIPGRLHIGWVHTDYEANYWTKAYYDRCKETELDTMTKYDHILCVSEQVRHSIITTIGDPGNLLVRYNPIPVEEIRKKTALPMADGDSKSNPNVIRFVMVGRIHEQKGYDLLIEAVRLLKDRAASDLPAFEIVIVGSDSSGGKHLRKLEKLKKTYAIDNVQFLGPRENPYPIVASADWFLSTSRYEGYAISSQEAAALGVPLILTDCSGARELIGDSEYGLLIKKDPGHIAETIQRVLLDPKLNDYYRKRILERSKTIHFHERLREIEALFSF